MTYLVRVEFTHDGVRLHDFLGPFDRYFAELVCVDFAGAPYQYGLELVRVESARIVPQEETA